MKLTIGVVTMNRAMQLKEALTSCLLCILPKETEFIVIDNASADNTAKVVEETLGTCGYSYVYKRKEKNVGVGRGRNLCFQLAKGCYVYNLDDDAIVDYLHNPNFFMNAIQIMDKNAGIVTLTTQIYDTTWKSNRVTEKGPMIKEGIYKCKMFCGGSHFLRKDFFKYPPYFPNQYGYEELPPSLIAADAGKLNVFCPELLVIHKPAVNKWDYANVQNQELLIKGCAIPYAIKRMMYPKITLPVLFIAYQRRCAKYLKHTAQKKQANRVVQETISNYAIEYRVKMKSIIQMYRDFGLSIF